jgi:hypothetical protein
VQHRAYRYTISNRVSLFGLDKVSYTTVLLPLLPLLTTTAVGGQPRALSRVAAVAASSQSYSACSAPQQPPKLATIPS